MDECYPSEKLRIVQLLDADPGRRDTGQPIVILRLGHCGEVEPALMLSVWDARRLVTLMCLSLATHGDELASHAYDQLTAALDHQHQWQETGDPEASTPLGPLMHLRCEREGRCTEVTVSVLGGYKSGRTTIVLAEFPSSTVSAPVEQRTLQLMACGFFKKPVSANTLVAEVGDWGRFATLPADASFKLGKRIWKKLPLSTVAKLVSAHKWKEGR